MNNPALDDNHLLDQLRLLVDPEIGLNIVDLGMVTSVAHDDNGAVQVIITPTSPNCPMHDQIVNGARLLLEQVAGVSAVEIQLSLDPPWNPEWITPEGRAFLARES